MLRVYFSDEPENNELGVTDEDGIILLKMYHLKDGFFIDYDENRVEKLDKNEITT